MNSIMIEVIGILSTVLILIGMCFKTTTIKGSIFMRAFNIIGSTTFLIYGILLPAYSTAILNGILILVNSYHLILLLKQKNKKD